MQWSSLDEPRISVSFGARINSHDVSSRECRASIVAAFADSVIMACRQAGIEQAHILYDRTSLHPILHYPHSVVTCSLLLRERDIYAILKRRNLQGFIPLPDPWMGKASIRINSKNRAAVRLMINTHDPSTTVQDIEEFISRQDAQPSFIGRAPMGSRIHRIFQATKWIVECNIPAGLTLPTTTAKWQIYKLPSLPPAKNSMDEVVNYLQKIVSSPWSTDTAPLE